MRLLRLLFATALGFLSLIVVVLQVIILIQADAEPLHPLQHAVLSALAVCAMVTAYYYAQPRAHWMSQLRCPQCHEKGALTLSILRRPGVSVGAHILGGALGSLLFSHARKRGYVCGACQEPCELRTFGGWVALIWLLFVVLAIVAELYVGEAS